MVHGTLKSEKRSSGPVVHKGVSWHPHPLRCSRAKGFCTRCVWRMLQNAPPSRKLICSCLLGSLRSSAGENLICFNPAFPKCDFDHLLLLPSPRPGTTCQNSLELVRGRFCLEKHYSGCQMVSPGIFSGADHRCDKGPEPRGCGVDLSCLPGS